MKLYYYLSLFTMGSVCLQGLELPENPDYKDFSIIKEKDAFGKLPEKIVITAAAPKKEEELPPEEEFILKGVTKMGEGWFVVVANRKAPGENVILKEGVSNGLNIEIGKVTKHPLDYRKTEVEILVDDKPQTISYDTALIAKMTTPKVKAPVSPSKKNPASKTSSKTGSSTAKPVIIRRR